MAIQFQCPHCAAAIQVPDSSSGKIGRCPACQERLRVPEIAPPSTDAAANAGTTAPPTAQQPIPTAAAVPPGSSSEDSIDLFGEPQPELSAREEYELGKSWLAKPVIPGAGWPAADRAVGHFSRAAELDPTNGDYAMQAGAACLMSIERFLQSWGEGPLVTVSALLMDEPLGPAIDQSEGFFRGNPLTEEHRQLVRERAAEALQWYAKAMRIDPKDSVTQASRAHLLSRIGAFGPALSEAAAVLSSPLAPSNARQQAQSVTDFVLSDESPLRKFLTRSEAQRLSGPSGLDLQLNPAENPAPTAPPPAPPVEEPFPMVGTVIGLRSEDLFGGAVPSAPGSAPVVQEPVGKSVAYSYRMKRKRSGGGGVLRLLIPVVFLLLLAGGVGLWLWLEQPTFTGSVTAEAWDELSLQKIVPRNTFLCSNAGVDHMLTSLQADPIEMRSQFRFVRFSGTPEGLDVLIRNGDEGRFVSVDLRSSHPQVESFVRSHLAQLEIQRLKSVEMAAAAFCQEWDGDGKHGLHVGEAASYIDSLGGEALVGALGYHTAANLGDRLFPCVFEDEQGRLYFLVPRSTTQFRIVERPHAEGSVFPREFGFDVTVSQVSTAHPTQTLDERTPESPSETAEDAEDESR